MFISAGRTEAPGAAGIAPRPPLGANNIKNSQFMTFGVGTGTCEGE